MTRSVRARLLLAGALAISVALMIAWLMLGLLFERHLERSEQGELIALGTEMLVNLSAEGSPEPLIDDAGLDPEFGRPGSGLYWMLVGETELVRSRSLWDEAIPVPVNLTTERWSAGVGPGPFGQDVLWVARRVRIGRNAEHWVLLLARDHSAIAAARNDFSEDLAAYLFVLGGTLLVAAWVQVQAGLRPLHMIKALVGDLSGQRTARISVESLPTEVLPLAEALNAMADQRETELRRARHRAANLAHSLKTPLAAIRAQARKAGALGQADICEGIERTLRMAEDVLEAELVLTRSAADQGRSCRPREVADRLIRLIEKAPIGEDREFLNEIPDQSIGRMSEAVLMELMGPLIENAARYSRGQIRIALEPEGLVCEDNGHGIPKQYRDLVVQRGVRLDQQGEGHGLGLSIVSELCAQLNLKLTIGHSALGGARVTIGGIQAA